MVVADFHGKPSGESNLLKYLEHDYDCLILIGDFTHLGPVSAAEEILDRIKVRIPMFCVPGNCDPKQIVDTFESRGVNLHKKCVKLGELTFIGLGGSNLTPFNTPFEFTEAEIWEELTALAKGASGGFVLVTDVPPHDTKVDEIQEGTHVGSKSVRQFIEQKQPLLALCAHVHEARNKDELGRTVIVNPGPVTEGYAAAVTIDKGVNVELLKL